jgi:ABC-type oligopeptide transport system ATPase subunit
MSALLELDKVGKTFARGGLFSSRRVEAVKEVSFALRDETPEIFTVIGESGSGKSTLARMILGIDAPSSGSIRLAGQDVAAYERRCLHGQGAADLPESVRGLQPAEESSTTTCSSTARRFGAHQPTRRPIEPGRRGAAAGGPLAQAEVAGRFPHELSGGQLQRSPSPGR